MIYRTHFYRSNFAFGKEVKQTADVVFECDSEDDQDIQEAAWSALRGQTGWSDENENLPHDQGWGSVLWNHDWEEVHIPYQYHKIEQPSEGKPVIGCSFSVEDKNTPKGYRTYRATHFYRLESYEPDYGDDEFMRNFMRERDIEEGLDPDRTRYRLVMCLPEDANVVSGSGVAGIMIAINRIKVGELVPWNELSMRQEQGQYADKVAKLNENEIARHNFHSGPTIPRLLEELGIEQ